MAMDPTAPELPAGIPGDLIRAAFDEAGPIDQEKLAAFQESLKDLPEVTFELTFVPNEWTIEKLLFVQTWKPEAVEDRDRFMGMLHGAIGAELRAQYPEVLKTLAAVALKMTDQTELLQRALDTCRQGSWMVDQVCLLAESTTDPKLKEFAALVVEMFNVTDEPDAPADGS